MEGSPATTPKNLTFLHALREDIYNLAALGLQDGYVS
jgi:hypothetical protein